MVHAVSGIGRLHDHCHGLMMAGYFAGTVARPVTDYNSLFVESDSFGQKRVCMPTRRDAPGRGTVDQLAVDCGPWFQP